MASKESSAEKEVGSTTVGAKEELIGEQQIAREESPKIRKYFLSNSRSKDYISRTGHGHETNKDRLCVEILERELRRDPMSEAEERFRNRSC